MVYFDFGSSIIQPNYSNLRVAEQMENDVYVDQVRRENTLKEEKLRKMKNNIEALQLSLTKKQLMDKPKTNNRPEPVAIYDPPHPQPHPSQNQFKLRSPVNFQTSSAADNDFAYNSTLFKNIANDSQPIMNNGSGVSNFSSVSNINNILNAQHNIERTDFQVNSTQNASNNDELMSNIDRVLSKVNRSNHLPTKTLEKLMSGKETEKYGREEEIGARFGETGGELTGKARLQELKQRIHNLDTIQEEHPRRDSGRNRRTMDQESWKQEYLTQQQKYFPKTMQLDVHNQQGFDYRTHPKEPSGLTFRSDYASEQASVPPTPPSHHPPKPPANAVERQKLRIKELMSTKRLQTESSHDIFDKSLDFELSDEEPEEEVKVQAQPFQQTSEQTSSLLAQKKSLEDELQQIELELSQLESAL